MSFKNDNKIEAKDRSFSVQETLAETKRSAIIEALQSAHAQIIVLCKVQIRKTVSASVLYSK